MSSFKDIEDGHKVEFNDDFNSIRDEGNQHAKEVGDKLKNDGQKCSNKSTSGNPDKYFAA